MKMKIKLSKLTALILTFVMFVSLLPLNVFAEDSTLHPLGCIPDDPEVIKQLLTASAGNAGTNTTKTKVDLTNIFPNPGSQGNLQSCTAWAVAYLKSAQETVKRGWSRTADTHMFSPLFIYNQINGGLNVPTNITTAMDTIVSSGVCSVKYFPYTDADNACKLKPSNTAKANAKLYRSIDRYACKGVQEIKNMIANNSGVVISIEVYPDFDNISNSNQIYDTVSGGSRGRHAICLIGFDDSKNAFKFINSWGADWGLGGYGWISYNLVAGNTVNANGGGIGFYMLPREDDYILGDVNGDGKISIVDSKYVLQYDAQSRTLTDRQFALADVNGDAKVSIADSKSILNYITGNITKMPLYN